MCRGNDLIQIQFRDKQKAKYSNYVAETFNFFEIVAIMLTGEKKKRIAPPNLPLGRDKTKLISGQ